MKYITFEDFVFFINSSSSMNGNDMYKLFSIMFGKFDNQIEIKATGLPINNFLLFIQDYLKIKKIFKNRGTDFLLDRNFLVKSVPVELHSLILS